MFVLTVNTTVKTVEENERLPPHAVHDGKGQTDEAIADYSGAIEINPNFTAAHANLEAHHVKNGTVTTQHISPPQFVTIKQSVQFTLPYYGTVVLPAGTRLEFVSQEGSDVRIRYEGGEYAIPISATDLGR